MEEKILEEILIELKGIRNIMESQNKYNDQYIEESKKNYEDSVKRQKDIFKTMEGINPELAKMFNKFMGGDLDGK